MKYCKCKFSYVFDHECDTATVPCPNSERRPQVAILKESTPSSEREESQEDFDSLCYDLFRPAYHAADTGDYFRRGHHTSAKKINRDQFYQLLKLIKANLKEHFTITRRKP